VVLLSKGSVPSTKVNVEFDLDELDTTCLRGKATYEQIKNYVEVQNAGMKVSNLYISQVKRKCGIEVGENYNLPKSEDSKQPQCPKEKEQAIMDAFKYFGVI
jgi:23S rRNA (uracil1939-C5)-methyltransferase